MKLHKLFAQAVLTMLTFSFVACAMDDVLPNDGTRAVARLRQGYKEKPRTTAGDPPFRSVVGASVQIWENSFELAESDSNDSVCLKITKTPNWWGGTYGCFDTGAPAGTYDLSKIRSATFQAKASKSCTAVFALVLNVKKENSWDSATKECSLAESYQSFSIELSDDQTLNDDIDTLFQVLNGTIEAGDFLYIKDFAFFDANGNEVVPIPK